MKKIYVRIQLVEANDDNPLREIIYNSTDYPDSITEWVEHTLEDLWEYRLDDEE